MRRVLCLILLMGLLALSGTAITACTCQQEGAYEKCVEQGGALCLDIYPKCS